MTLRSPLGRPFRFPDRPLWKGRPRCYSDVLSVLGIFASAGRDVYGLNEHIVSAPAALRAAIMTSRSSSSFAPKMCDFLTGFAGAVFASSFFNRFSINSFIALSLCSVLLQLWRFSFSRRRQSVALIKFHAANRSLSITLRRRSDLDWNCLAATESIAASKASGSSCADISSWYDACVSAGMGSPATPPARSHQLWLIS